MTKKKNKYFLWYYFLFYNYNVAFLRRKYFFLIRLKQFLLIWINCWWWILQKIQIGIIYYVDIKIPNTNIIYICFYFLCNIIGFIRLSYIYIFIYLSINKSIYLSFNIFIYIFSMSIYQSIYRSVYKSISHLYIYLSIYRVSQKTPFKDIFQNCFWIIKLVVYSRHLRKKL